MVSATSKTKGGRKEEGYHIYSFLMENLLFTQTVWPSSLLMARIFLGQTHLASNGSQAPFAHVKFVREHRSTETRPALITSENCHQ